jgi:putative Mn2+ efflux pump MntP
MIGAYAGKRISFPVEILGGIILIGIGIKILVEHLTA